MKTDWNSIAERERQTAKFLRKGTRVTLLPTAPQETTIEGKYGKRRMFIVDTVEFGLVYVSPVQFLAISQVYSGGENKVSVEL